MNTLEFFQATLPAEGTYFLALFRPGNAAPAHKAFNSIEAMAEAVARIEQTNPTWSVYHACATYKQPFVEVEVKGETKKKYRIKENWDKAKSFWCDIDCGEDKASEGKGYATKKEAATAIVNFCTKTGFPRPMFIDSGNGVHCYWPLSRAIHSDTWLRIAYALKAVFAAHGLLVDPSRTADFASILRPVGSFHKKGQPKEVVCRQLAVETDPRELATLVASLSKDIEVPKPPVSQAMQAAAAEANADLIQHAPRNTPTSIIEIANHCNQVAEMRDMHGEVGYDQWRGVIGLIKHCIEGDEIAHEWSSGAQGYSEQETQTKLDTWNSPPTTCKFFNSCNPKGCEGCPSKDQIKTPMVLGHIIVKQEAEVVEALVDGEKMEVQIPEFPHGYRHDNGMLIRSMKDKDDNIYEVTVSPNLFYPLYRIRKEDGTYSLKVRVHLPNGRTREAEINTNCLASPQELAKALAQHEVLGSNLKDANLHMNAYMKEFLQKLMREADEMNTMTTYGWSPEFNSFLLGDRLYHADGTIRQVFVGGSAKSLLPAFKPRGTVEGYTKAITHIYNRPGMEPMQYALMSAFGSILTPLVDSQYKGLIMSMAGSDTAKGKTTVCMAGLYAFGNADTLKIAGGTAGATLNGQFGTMATLQNIPLLFDELTHVKPEIISSLAMQVTNGKGKIREQVKNNIVQLAETKDFALSLYATSNDGLHGKLAEAQGNSQAEAVRVIEINIDRYPATKIDPEVEDIEPVRSTIERNSGAAGDLFIRYVVTHMEEVAIMIAANKSRLGIQIKDTRYRFWKWHAAATLTALQITNKLGITQFDYEKLYEFTVELFSVMGDSVTTQNTITPEEALHKIISSLHDRIIVTSEYRDSRDGRGPEYANVRGEPVGRYVNGNINSKDEFLAGKLFICRKEFITECKPLRTDPEVVLEYARSAGVLVPFEKKFTLGRGTNVKTGNTNVVCIDQIKLESLNTDAPKLTIAASKVSNIGSKVAAK